MSQPLARLALRQRPRGNLRFRRPTGGDSRCPMGIQTAGWGSSKPSRPANPPVQGRGAFFLRCLRATSGCCDRVLCRARTGAGLPVIPRRFPRRFSSGFCWSDRALRCMQEKRHDRSCLQREHTDFSDNGLSRRTRGGFPDHKLTEKRPVDRHRPGRVAHRGSTPRSERETEWQIVFRDVPRRDPRGQVNDPPIRLSAGRRYRRRPT